jgi:hypothetical protein
MIAISVLILVINLLGFTAVILRVNRIEAILERMRERPS